MRYVNSAAMMGLTDDEPAGFECTVDDEEAENWIRLYRSQLTLVETEA